MYLRGNYPLFWVDCEHPLDKIVGIAEIADILFGILSCIDLSIQLLIRSPFEWKNPCQ